MPSYTLYYFNGRGRAEVIRMMFGAAGAQFTDKRYEFSEWEKHRNEMPSYCMPVLEIDGKNRVPETMAICRHLAREFGFYGKTNMEMFRIDYISDCLYEIMHDYMRYFHEKNGRFRNLFAGLLELLLSEVNSKCPVIGCKSANHRPLLQSLQKTQESAYFENIGLFSPAFAVVNIASPLLRQYSMSSTMASNTKGNMASNVKSGMSISATSSMSSSMKSNMSSNPNSSMSTDMKTNMSSNPNSHMGSAMSSTGSYMQMRFMDSCRRIMPFLERTLNVYCCGNQFFMGEHLMMCDMMLYCFLESPMMECHSMFQSYPKVMALWKRVGTHPKIASYLKTRINSNW